ncbi:hypothetical protein diail_10865 [Diaporthe ilicicola]|nr:hypothetical protein diail_10865 [Diaporthe ilicicola]
MTFQQPEYMHRSNTGGSSRSKLSSRNPYLESEDQIASRKAENTQNGSPWHAADQHQCAPSAHNAYHNTGETTFPGSSSGQPASPEPPPLPSRPDDEPAAWSHISPQSQERYSPDDFEQRPGLPPRPPHEQDDHSRSPERIDELELLPPRRRLTTGDIPVTNVGYTRNPEKLIAYLIPLPPPSAKGQTLDVPQRYMIYTPPAPHLLKPAAGTKEGKRHKVKRIAQQEVKKAKTFEGKTLSLRGLHYKAVRGCDWAVAAIKNTDITFLNRVPRKQVTELVLVHPASVLADHSPAQVHAEVGAQLRRTQRRAARDSIVSTVLFPPALAIDTLAAVIWPFGGLAEIDGVWMYASISGYLTARSVTRRMESEPVVDEEGAEVRDELSRSARGLSPVSEEDIYTAGIETSRPSAAEPSRRDSRRDSRQVHFEEQFDEEHEDLKKAAGDGKKKDTKKKTLKVRMVPDEAMDTMASYFQEICHQRNPKAFGSAGIPPTKTDVLASIGWWPDRRGRAPGVDNPGAWDDENWQTRQVKEDLDKVLTKAAKSWDKWYYHVEQPFGSGSAWFCIVAALKRLVQEPGAIWQAGASICAVGCTHHERGNAAAWKAFVCADVMSKTSWAVPLRPWGAKDPWFVRLPDGRELVSRSKDISLLAEDMQWVDVFRNSGLPRSLVEDSTPSSNQDRPARLHVLALPQRADGQAEAQLKPVVYILIPRRITVNKASYEIKVQSFQADLNSTRQSGAFRVVTLEDQGSGLDTKDTIQKWTASPSSSMDHASIEAVRIQLTESMAYVDRHGFNEAASLTDHERKELCETVTEQDSVDRFGEKTSADIHQPENRSGSCLSRYPLSSWPAM